MFSQNKFLFDSATIEIKSLNINSSESEFSPFKIGKEFYYTSSKERKVGVTHMEISTDHQMLDIYKGNIIDSVTIKNISALPNKINNSVHQGSCFFDKENSRLFYSADVPTNNRYKKYKLAIFSSELKGGEFLQPRIELLMADTFSAAHPMVYNGRLYFSSNLPGGKGKTDIYYAEKIDMQWANIKNCKYLNTSENEYFPFVLSDNEIYFSSNRSGGYGKLDIYKCTGIDSLALIQNVGSPVNTAADDFGVYIDSLQESGYFSTNRKKNQDDIYFFSQTWPVFKNCKEAIIEDYCYNLTEESTLDSDSLKGYYYEWNFGDGLKQKGLTVRHCFVEPGNYLINLSIIDSVTRAVFMSQATFDLKVDSIIQLKINTLDTVLLNKKFNINTDWTYLPDNKITGYYFEIDGKRMRGNSHDIAFQEKGRHKVLLGVSTINSKTKLKELLCTTKEIVCVDSLLWLAVEKRKIKEIADKFAYKKFPGDSAVLNNMNYANEEMAFNKKGLNGSLVAAELKKIVDEKIASKTNNNENLAVTEPTKEISKDPLKEPLASVDTPTNADLVTNTNIENAKADENSGQKYLNPIMDTLMNIKEDEDVNFKVHLGTSKTLKDTTLLNAKGINGIEEKKINDEYHYTYGNEKKLKDIEKYYDKTIKAGIEDAVVVGYKKDSIIGTQSKNITNVDFDKVKTKDDSLRIEKNIAAKNALNKNNLNSKLTSDQLRLKANKLLESAFSEKLKADDIKELAVTKPEKEKDSLMIVADELIASSQNKKLEASSLNQKANNLDFDKNGELIDGLLNNLTKGTSKESKEFEKKESVIDSLKTQTEVLTMSAKQIPDRLDKITALNSIEKKEEDILQQQQKLITDLQKKDPLYATKNKSADGKELNTPNNKLSSTQLRAKANTLLAKANKDDLMVDEIRTSALTKPPLEKDSLLAVANILESNAQKNRIEAADLLQKANLLDYNSNDKSINSLLAKTKIKNPALGTEISLKNNEIKETEKQLKNQTIDANKLTNNLEKITALNNIQTKEAEIIQKQEQLISELKNQNSDNIAINNKKSDSSLNKEEIKSNTSQAEQNNKTNNSNENNKITNSANTNESLDTETEAKDFVAFTDIQKTNLEYLEEFGDLSAEDLEFKVQVGVFKKRTSYHFPKLRGLGKVSNERLKDGSTRMTMGGSYKTLRQAFRHNKKISRAGQRDAFVSVYYKGQRIGIENLRKRGVLVKTQVVMDSVSLTKVTINASNLTEYAQVDAGDDPEETQQSNTLEKIEEQTAINNTSETSAEDNFVFVPRTNIQKKTVFYAEKYGDISAEGLEFKVQIAIFKYRSSYSFPKLKSLGKIETEISEEGGTRMTIGGSFKTLNEAFEFNKKVVKAGQTDAFVAVYYQNKRIYLENLERKGIFTSGNKDNKTD